MRIVTAETTMPEDGLKSAFAMSVLVETLVGFSFSEVIRSDDSYTPIPLALRISNGVF